MKIDKVIIKVILTSGAAAFAYTLIKQHAEWNNYSPTELAIAGLVFTLIVTCTIFFVLLSTK